MYVSKANTKWMEKMHDKANLLVDGSRDEVRNLATLRGTLRGYLMLTKRSFLPTATIAEGTPRLTITTSTLTF